MNADLPLAQLSPDQDNCPIRLLRGRVNVFATAPGGTRRHLFTLAAPAVLLPMRLGAIALTITAMAEAETAEEADFWQDAEAAEAVAPWVAALANAAGRLPGGRPAREHSTDGAGPISLPPGEVLESPADTVWLRVLEGDGVLYDNLPVGPDGALLFPLAPGAWLRGFEAMRLEPVDPAHLHGFGLLRAAVEEFTAMALRQLATGLALAELDDRQRRDRRDRRLGSDLDRVLGDLGRMIGAVPPTRAKQGANQAWFHVAQEVARGIGVRVQMPAAVRDAGADVAVPLADILEASGLRAREVALPQGWFQEDLGDLVGSDAASGAPLALLRRAGRYTRLDPATGARRAIDSASVDSVATVARTLYEPLADTRVTMTQLCFFGLQGCGWDMAVFVLAAVLGAAAASIPALGARLVMQELIPQHLTGILLEAGAALALVAVLRAVGSYAGNIAYGRIRMRSSARLKAALWDRVLRQPMGFFTRYTAPDLTLRCNTAEQIVMAVHQLVQQLTVTVAMLVINTATMLWLSRVGGLAATGLVALQGFAIWLAWLGQKRAFRQGEAAEGATSVFVHALTNGMRKIRLAGAEDRAFVKWADRFSRSRLKLINVRRVTNLFLTFTAGFDLAAMAAVLAILAVLRQDDLPMATLFGFIVAFATVMGSMAAMGRAVTGVAFQFASIPYCQPVLDAVAPREARKASPGRLSGAVELANVHFRYGDGEPVLGGISLRIKAGSFVALVGATGCGKSTLIKLLLGLEKPQGGAVLFDDRDLDGMDVDAVRRQIGTVLQRPALMPGSLFDNIRGIAEAGEAEVWQAAEAAGIAEDIRAMPMGLQTLVGEQAGTFSGGQVQRLAIARAIVQRPALLLLDEATSALDNGLQAQVSDNLARLACTRIVVAHRLSTIRQADRIVVLEKGAIVEEGNYEELLAAGGAFAAFASRQMAD